MATALPVFSAPMPGASFPIMQDEDERIRALRRMQNAMLLQEQEMNSAVGNADADAALRAENEAALASIRSQLEESRREREQGAAPAVSALPQAVAAVRGPAPMPEPTADAPPPAPTRALPQAVEAAKSTLTQNAQPGDAVGGYQQRSADLYRQATEAMNQEPDMAAAQNYMRQRSRQGDMAMLNALAAQFAGERFEPVQAQFLKRAAAAQEPLKVGRGMITPDGQFVRDEGAAQDRRVELLLQQAKAYEQMALTAQTERERAAAREAQNQILNELRLFQAQTGRINAQTQQMLLGGGGLGTGNAQQIGSGGNKEPIFRSPNGALFTYNEQGVPVPYQGPVNPKESSAQPSEDERKAAGWFWQADTARRNIAAIMERNPAAAYPTVIERVAGATPKFGEDIANSLRTEDRQMFVQAASSMSEALLRAATGAGVNESEARQKAAELTPQLGDKPGTVKQKMDAYAVYMRSLQARAGRALPTQPTPGAAPSAASQDDPLGLRKR